MHTCVILAHCAVIFNPNGVSPLTPARSSGDQRLFSAAGLFRKRQQTLQGLNQANILSLIPHRDAKTVGKIVIDARTHNYTLSEQLLLQFTGLWAKFDQDEVGVAF
jgi:hypothetical protein